MNKITQIQNESEQLELLAAQREIYSSAKLIYFFQFLGSVVLPIIFSLISLFLPSFSIFTASYALFFFIIDYLFFEPRIKERKTTAAKIQEIFDCKVLEIKKSPFKNSDDVLIEEIQDSYEKHTKIKNKKIQNWYANGSEELTPLPVSLARLICQRENMWWDAKLRKRYYGVLFVVNLIMLGAILFSSVKLKLGIEQIVLIFSGLLPLLRFSIKQYADNKESSEKLVKMCHYFDRIKERLIKNEIDEVELDESARHIQNELYDNRTRSPLIPDFFNYWFEPKHQSLVNSTTQKLIKEFKQLNLKTKEITLINGDAINSKNTLH